MLINYYNLCICGSSNVYVFLYVMNIKFLVELLELFKILVNYCIEYFFVLY